MRYFKGTIDRGLRYSSGLEFGEELSAFVDSDFVGDQEERFSTTGADSLLSRGIDWLDFVTTYRSRQHTNGGKYRVLSKAGHIQFLKTITFDQQYSIIT